MALIRSAYGPKNRTTAITFTGEGRTKQSFADDSDINNIMARYLKTGLIEAVNKHEPQYGDTTGINFQACMDTVVAAKAMFADMPAKIRNRFDNDPGKFLDFVNNPENIDEGVKLGLLTPRAPAVVSEAPAAPAALQEPQNRTDDGRFTFDNPPSGPEGDAPSGARRRGPAR